MTYNSPIKISKKTNENINTKIILIEKGTADANLGLDQWHIEKINESFEGKSEIYQISNDKENVFIVSLNLENKKDTDKLEVARKLGSKLYNEISKLNIEQIEVSKKMDTCFILPFVEGIVLTSYKFQKYLSKITTEKISQIFISCSSISENDVKELNIILESNFIARDLVNEPVITLNAVVLSQQIERLGKEAGFNVNVLHKKELEEQGFGGLLSVNMGSVVPPTFSIMEYKPQNAKNAKPYVLVGKGLVYDTGGLSLKPTANSMDSMKSDMAGSAAVIGAMYAIAKNNLPIYIVGLIPSTDNRPGENAYTPGDIIKLHNGKTVEVLNTDAEGRLILGDALSYASKYEPELCLDLATLTGAQVVAIGSLGAAIMGNAPDNEKGELVKAGNEVYERVAEMPFWEEYGEKVKSEIADLKNVGGPEGGCITAGKFLEAFVSYPWIHIDIAGPSFYNAKSNYIPKGGTGFGVKLLYQFLKSKI